MRTQVSEPCVYMHCFDNARQGVKGAETVECSNVKGRGKGNETRYVVQESSGIEKLVQESSGIEVGAGTRRY
ncbi:hypothetical protein POVWA2_039870 [Plasmodium ovale wallikeri]|uniref:Uncharacterized protein n=1 Tax=Plasmodium ovale wallikeri TaxID=864142 RepID=A0A1A8Z892_PLAOA|nr:hypothetical protein POVWA1_041300 [Plasmodium ovale wallikeri]SBT40532.1 hypothetical protein POVWA2_039870 [Plasmodium ovale wallikeri]